MNFFEKIGLVKSKPEDVDTQTSEQKKEMRVEVPQGARKLVEDDLRSGKPVNFKIGKDNKMIISIGQFENIGPDDITGAIHATKSKSTEIEKVNTYEIGFNDLNIPESRKGDVDTSTLASIIEKSLSL